MAYGCESEKKKKRWSTQSRDTLRKLAAAKARASPETLAKSAQAAWFQRWGGMLSVAQQDSLAATLVDDVPTDLDGVDGVAPLDVDVWVEARHTAPGAPQASTAGEAAASNAARHAVGAA